MFKQLRQARCTSRIGRRNPASQRPGGVAASILLTGSLLFASLAAAAVDLSRRVQFDIPAQPLATALLRFSEQASVQLAAPSELLGGLETQGLRGEHATGEALGVLLSGTGLTFQALDEQTVAIRREKSSRSNSLGEPAGIAGARASLSRDSSNDRPLLTQIDDSQVKQQEVNKRNAREAERLPASPENSVELGEIVVTGTHIRGVAPDSSPITIYGREDIERSGVATVDQFARTMPQNFSSVDDISAVYTVARLAGGSFDQGGRNVSFGAGFNIHGLGPGATLVLLNGRRLAGAGSDAAFTDVSLIPLSAVERIEVLTDGASAIYGADAIAGVVNMVLRRDYDGAETSLRYGGATRGGADEFTGSQLLGRAWGSGDVLLAYEYDKQHGLLASQRDFIPEQGPDTGVPGNVIPEQERNSVFVTGQQALSQRTTLSGDAFYSEREFVNDFAPVLLGPTVVQTFNRGETRQYGATVNLGLDFMEDWHAGLEGSFSKLEQPSTLTSSDVSIAASSTSATDTENRGVDLRANGSLFSLGGGRARAAIGVGFRTDELDTSGTVTDLSGTTAFPAQHFERDVASAYGELFLPFVGATNAKRGVHRLELSLAGRYEDYDDVGSSTNPKVGALWSPVEGLNLRGTYATSFRVPLLRQLVERQSYFAFPLPDPAAPDGETVTLINFSAGNPNLKPEESTSVTVGIDFKPPQIPGLFLSASYFDIDFTDQIANPPIVGDFFFLYSQTEALDPFIDRSPDPAEVQTAFDSGTVFDPLGVGPSGVEATFDNRITNLATTKESGIELSAAYDFATAYGDIGLSLMASHLLRMDFQGASTAATVALLDTLNQPVDWRLNGGMSWSRNGFAAAVTVHYWDDYENTLFTPAQKIDSWTTVDLQLSYRTNENAASWPLRNLTIALSVQNLTDEDPPAVTVPPEIAAVINPGYDAANANPLGRVIALQMKKGW